MVTIHRTPLKVILNPVLRKFGYVVVSCFDNEDAFLGYQLRTFPDTKPLNSKKP